MPYDPQLVISPWTGYFVQRSGLVGMPSVCRYLLYSAVVCLPTDSGGSSGPSSIVNLSGPSGLGDWSIDSNKVSIRLLPGVSQPAILNATLAHDSHGVRSHLLMSVDTVAQTLQVYVNDTPLSITTGGWSGSGTMHPGTGPAIQWTVGSAGSWSAAPGGGPGVADVWLASPDSFFDLSITANRRRFINADLSLVDLGTDGSEPLGVAPPIFLTVRPGDTNADHFKNNNGTGGGPWTASTAATPIVFEPGGLCTIPSIPGGGGGSGTETLIDSELYFTPTTGFIDFSNPNVRRLFVSAGNGAQFLGADGARPLGFSPSVYLTTRGGDARSFAQNNGAAGPFAVTNDIEPYPLAPGCTPYLITEAAGPASAPEWRLTVSDDGGRTWSTLVKPRHIGAEGEYLTRLRWLKLGHARERMMRLECSDPVRRNIVGVYIDAKQGMG